MPIVEKDENGGPEAETPLPWLKVFPVLLLLFAEAISGYSIFAYQSYMVIDFLPELEGQETKLGYYAGFLGSAFYIGQFLSSFFWGAMSDRFGRRPVMLLGSFGSFVCILAYSFSTNYIYAVITRFLSGLLNGNLGVIKTYLGEVTDSSNQARAFSYFSLAQGIGGIIGSMMGGYLCRPSKNYPSVFAPEGFFATFPYFLVNIIAALILLVGFVLTFFYLTENAKSSPATEVTKNLTVNAQVEMEPVKLEVDDEDTDEDEKRDLFAKELAANDPELKDFGESRENIFIQLARFVLPHRLSQKWFPEQFGVFPEWSIFRDFVAVLACVEYAVLGFMFIMFDEIFPTWSVAKVEHDGLGFSSADIGITAAFGGLSIVIIQKFIYPPFVKRTKLLPCMRLGIIIGIVVFTLFPMLTWVARYGHGAVFWICHLVIYALRQLSGQFSFTTIIQMVNNSVRLEHMGATNGLGQSLVAFFRAIGPFTGGTLVAWSLRNGIGFPFNHFFPFFVANIIGILVILMSFKLPTRVNKAYREALADL